MVCGSLACFVFSVPDSFLASWCVGPFFLPVLSVVLSLLLVSEIPMFSMKFGGGNKSSRMENVKRIVFAVVAMASVLLVALTHQHWSLIVLAAFSGYILINLAFAPFCHSERNACHSEHSEESK